MALIQFSRIQNLHISQTKSTAISAFSCLVEFKIYISLKQNISASYKINVQQNSKFTYLSNSLEKISLTLKFSRIQNLHISQTSFLMITKKQLFSRIQNLHISQTAEPIYTIRGSLVEFKIYISLKLLLFLLVGISVQQNSKFTYLSNCLVTFLFEF